MRVLQRLHEGLKILVVEDDRIVAALVDAMLTDLGCSVLAHAESVQAALAAIDQTVPELVLLDANLRALPALDVAERLTQRRIPFVVTTGYDTRTLPAALAAAVIVHKPFNQGMLRDAIATALKAKEDLAVPAISTAVSVSAEAPNRVP